jgi:uncharacterized membrane protein
MAAERETRERSRGEAAAAAARRGWPEARVRGAAVGMGLASVALGLAKIVAPRALTRLVGIADGAHEEGLVRALGARDVVVGLGLLASRRPTPWLWTRVAGDALELALLGAAVGARRAERGPAAGALGALAGVTALDVACAVAATRARPRTGTAVRRAVTIARERRDVYRFWRDFSNAPAFMADIESVEVLDERRSRWSAHGPVGPVVSWEVHVDEERPDEILRWRSVEGAQSDVRAEGVVRFADAPGGRGTEVELELRYGLPDDAPERAAAFVARASAPQRIEADLARGKELLETGRVSRADGAANGGGGLPG